MKRFSIYLCFFLIAFQSFSQAFDITGQVIDLRKQPIPFVHITDIKTKTTVVSDVLGNFSIGLENKLLQLVLKV